MMPVTRAPVEVPAESPPVEVRKDYIDEWSGEVDGDEFERVDAALRSAVPGLLEELAAVEEQGR